LTLIVISADVAAFSLVLLSAHTLWVNRTLLPPEIRPPWWRQAGLALGSLFFAALVALAASRPERLLALLWRDPPPAAYF